MTVPPFEQVATLAETTTTADPGTGGSTLAVTNRSPFPQAGQFTILVQNAENDKTNREIMIVTAGTGAGAGSFTVTRGADGGPAAVAHPIGSYVAYVLTGGGILRIAHRLPDPSDQSLLTWSGDSIGAFDSSTATLVSGTLQIVKVPLPFAMTISNVVYAVTNAGVTLTSAQNFVGIYDKAGTRQALSADQSAIWTSTGLKTTAMTAPWTPAAFGMAEFCWIVFLSVGTTPPRFAVLNNTANTGAIAAINAGTTTANIRQGRNAAAQTALPSTITLGSNVNSGVSIWAGLS